MSLWVTTKQERVNISHRILHPCNLQLPHKWLSWHVPTQRQCKKKLPYNNRALCSQPLNPVNSQLVVTIMSHTSSVTSHNNSNLAISRSEFVRWHFVYGSEWRAALTLTCNLNQDVVGVHVLFSPTTTPHSPSPKAYLTPTKSGDQATNSLHFVEANADFLPYWSEPWRITKSESRSVLSSIIVLFVLSNMNLRMSFFNPTLNPTSSSSSTRTDFCCHPHPQEMHHTSPQWCHSPHVVVAPVKLVLQGRCNRQCRLQLCMQGLDYLTIPGGRRTGNMIDKFAPRQRANWSFDLPCRHISPSSRCCA